MKKKRRKSKKGGTKKVLFVLFLVVIGIGCYFLFRQESSRLVRSRPEKQGLLEGKKEVTLYFSDPEAAYLVGEQRVIDKGKGVETEAGTLIRELIRGPGGKLLPTMPSKTKLLALHVDGKGMARVDFSGAFTRDHPGGSSAEMVTVYSIVNSLALNFREIKQVQFLVDGKEIETIKGHLSLRRPVSPKPDVIKGSNKKPGLPQS